MMRLLGSLLLAAAIITAVPTYAATPNAPVSLSNVRAIRISSTSVSFSFITNVSSVGKLEYTDLDSSTVTLTDSQSQVDHLFTVDQLDPTHGYAFTLSAKSDKGDSFKYSVLLSPDTIGPPGQSMLPHVDVVNEDGYMISSRLSASTTPDAGKAPSPWIFVISACAVLAAVCVSLIVRKW